MPIYALISFVKAKINKNRRLSALVIIFGALGYALLLAALIELSLKTTAFVLLGAFIAASLGAYILGYFEKASELSACQLLDEKFKTKDRCVSLIAASLEPAAEEYISKEVEALLKHVDTKEIEPLQFKKPLAYFVYSIPPVWILALYILFPGYRGIENFIDPQARLVQTILEEEKYIPPELRDALQELAVVLETQDDLQIRQEALNKAQAELEETKARKQESALQTAQETPTLEPSVPPEPTKEAQEEKKQEEETKEEQQKEQENQDKAEEERKQAEVQNSKSASGQEQSEDDSKNQSQKGSKESSGQSSEDQQEKDGDSGANKGEKSEEGQEPHEKDQKAESAASKGQSGQGDTEPKEAKNTAQNQALERVDSTLEKIQKEMQNQEGSGSGSSSSSDDKGGKQDSGEKTSSPDAKTPEGKDKQQENDESQQKDSNAEMSSDSAQKDKDPKRADEDQENSQASGTKEEQNSEKQLPSENKDSDNQSAEASRKQDQSAKLRPLPDGQEASDSELGGNKAFKDVEVSNKDEKYDSSYTGDTVELSNNEEEAQAKTEIAKIKLGKPQAINEKTTQPIPLEYRDLLK